MKALLNCVLVVLIVLMMIVVYLTPAEVLVIVARIMLVGGSLVLAITL